VRHKPGDGSAPLAGRVTWSPAENHSGRPTRLKNTVKGSSVLPAMNSRPKKVVANIGFWIGS
jgi:hypothetical protein